MATKERSVQVAVFALAAMLIFAGRAEAYVDPGSASYVFQVVSGLILAAGFLVRHYWARLKDTARRVFRSH
jgi:uncharacterized membrane protein